MTDLVRAELRELDADFREEINPDRAITVQFNPETLKVAFANQIAQGGGAGDQRGPQARQFVGAGTTKLSLQLWFDVTAPQGEDAVDDVRRLTQKVAYFITPRPRDDAAGAPSSGGGEQQPRFTPPAVRFAWGSFQFDGLMDQLEETLELWSVDGRPLRASVSFSLAQQKITVVSFDDAGGQGASRGPAASRTPGTRPLAQAPFGATLPGLAAAAGAGGSWQAIAAANGVEDPLRLGVGQLLDLSARG